MKETVYLEEHEIRQIVRDTVREVLQEMGADGDLRALQSDFGYLRRQRLGSEDVVKRLRQGGFAVLFMTVIPTALWVIVEGVKSLLGKAP